MVDPNRKINRLTEEDISFLDECEELFSNRFSEDDEEFMAHCAKPLCEPPVVLNFANGGGSSGNGNFGQSNSYRGRFNDNRQNFRGGRDNGAVRNRHFNRRRNPYNNDGGGRFNSNNRNYRNESTREGNTGRAPMNFRRDYGNFVPASSNSTGS